MRPPVRLPILCLPLLLSTVTRVTADSYDDAVAAILPRGNARTVTVAEVRGKGPGAANWETACQRVQIGLERALTTRKDDLKLIDRGNLAAIEQENALTGKATRIQAAEMIVAAQLLAIDGKVIASITASEIKSQAKQTTDIELNPTELGITLDADLPEADARVRTLNARAFDITRNLVKQAVLDEAFPPDSKGDTAKIAQNRRAVILSELNEWAETSVEEISALAKLEPDMVSRAIEDRRNYLIVEGRLRNIDTTRQIALLEQLQCIVQDLRKSGIEPSAAFFIQSCRKLVDLEKRKQEG